MLKSSSLYFITKEVIIIWIVYQHTNKTNGKKYIGITSRTWEERAGANGANYHSCPRFYAAIEKYGWDGFEHKILFQNLTQEQAEEKEKELIARYRTQEREYGYNILEGGQATTLPEEVRKKMSIAMMGNKNGLGKPCSEEKKKKISEAQKGRKFTDEHRAKLSVAKKGISRGPCPEEVKKKISDSHAKKQVYCQETNMIYPSIQQCGRDLGLEASAICAVCRGRYKSHHGYHFSYYNEEDKA